MVGASPLEQVVLHDRCHYYPRERKCVCMHAIAQTLISRRALKGTKVSLHHDKIMQ